MNITPSLFRLCALSATALVLATPPEASAVQLSTQVTSIYQVGVGAGVMLGHAAIGSTNYNRITVGGSYTAQCASPMMLPTSGQRTLTRDGLTGGLSLVTTIPQIVPTVVNMPGYNSLPAGTTVACTYSWTSRAVEGGYSIGPGGISFPSGNAERSDGGTQLFQMNVPAAAEDNSGDRGSCHP
jgi:hypothetical protein